jgi:hypothetical protein
VNAKQPTPAAASSQRVSPRRIGPGLILLGLGLILIALDAYAIYIVFSSRYPGAVDFYPRWYAARALTLEGRNPYDPVVARETQLGLFGRLMPATEDQAGFAYPLYLIFFIYPLTLLDYPAAQAIWMAVLQAALLTGVILCLKIVAWRPPLWLFTFTVVWSIFFYPAARAWLMGQAAILVFLFSVLAIWAFNRCSDRLAGLALALSTLKPHLVFLLIPLVLFYSLTQKRYTVLTSFGLTLLGLIGAAMLWLPSWPMDFLYGLRAYTGYQTYGSPLANLLDWPAPGASGYLEWLLTVILLGWLGYTWFKLLRGKSTAWLPVLSLTLIISNLVALRSASANHVMLFLPIFTFFSYLTHRGGKNWLIVALQLGLLILLWGIFLGARGNEFEQTYLHGLLPALLLLIYAFIWPDLQKQLPS